MPEDLTLRMQAACFGWRASQLMRAIDDGIPVEDLDVRAYWLARDAASCYWGWRQQLRDGC